MTEAVAVKADDPSTWPTDMESLAQLAEEAAEDGVEVASSDAAEEVPVAAAGVEDAGAAESPGAGAQDESASEAQPNVLAADGEHQIPHEVLAQTRRDLDAAQREAQRLRDELEQAQQGSAAGDAPAAEAGGAGVEAPGGPQPPLAEAEEFHTQRIDAIKEQIEAVGEDDPDLLKILNREMSAAERQRDLELRQLREEEGRAQSAHDAEMAEIRTAMDAAPLLAAWANDADRTWNDRAAQLHQTLLEIDPAYAGLGYAAQFAQLPGKVEALFGASPHAQAVKTQGEVADPAPTPAPVPKPVERMPSSLSQLSGGAADAASGDEYADLTRLDGAGVQRKLERLAEKGQLDAYLAGVGV